jgi:hypothetical protein
MRVIFALSLFLHVQNIWSIEINKESFNDLEYGVEVVSPDEHEPKFLKIKITFPDKIEEFYEYAYSSAVYAKRGERLLSYRPESTKVYSEEKQYIYVLAHEDVLKCLSVINVYFDRRDKSLHPPQQHVSFDLMSFTEAPEKKCKGKVNASNFY